MIIIIIGSTSQPVSQSSNQSFNSFIKREHIKYTFFVSTCIDSCF